MEGLPIEIFLNIYDLYIFILMLPICYRHLIHLMQMMEIFSQRGRIFAIHTLINLVHDRHDK